VGASRRGSRHSGKSVVVVSGKPQRYFKSKSATDLRPKYQGGGLGAVRTQPRSELVLDDTTIVINQPASMSTVNGVVAVNGKVTNTTTSVVEVRVDAGTYATTAGTLAWAHVLNLNALSNGSHSITVRSKNSGGVVLATKTIPFTYTANTSLPAGVTLRDIDGGANYYGAWSNSYSTSPSFFPFTVWAETLASQTDANNYANIGVTGIIHLWDGPTAAQMDRCRVSGLQVKGMVSDYIISPSFSATYGNTLSAYIFGDELDTLPAPAGLPAWLMAGYAYGVIAGNDYYTLPTAMRDMSNLIRERDATRPVCNMYTKPLCIPTWGSWYLVDADRYMYAAASDIVSFDWYYIVDPYNTGYVWDAYNAMIQVRGYALYCKPVIPAIGITEVFSNAVANPTLAQIGIMIWSSIIGGARGIHYFNHNFYPGKESQHVLIDPYYTTLRNYIHVLQDRISVLAPVINSRFADGYLTHSGTINHMVKYYGGKFYIFAAPGAAGSQNITFTLASTATTTATVIDESRTLTVTAGVFSDSFANENTVHIYRIE